MKAWWCIGIAAAGLSVLGMGAAAPVRAQDMTRIDVHTEAWEAYTERNGTGFAWDVIRAVYEPVGVRIDDSYVPYSRAIQDVLAGDADAWVGSYANEQAEALYPEWHYDADQVQALFLEAASDSWSGPASLEGARVAWMRGYAYARYLDVPVKRVLLNDRSRALPLLRLERIAYWLDAAYEIDHLLDNAPPSIDPDRFARRDVMYQRLYLAFADTARGRTLRRIWDRRFPELLESGRIAEIYDRWDMEVWPFDHARSES